MAPYTFLLPNSDILTDMYNDSNSTSTEDAILGVYRDLLLSPSSACLIARNYLGGRRLERDGWKQLPPAHEPLESRETEISNVIHNGPYAGKTLVHWLKNWCFLAWKTGLCYFGHASPC